MTNVFLCVVHDERMSCLAQYHLHNPSPIPLEGISHKLTTLAYLLYFTSD